MKERLSALMDDALDEDSAAPLFDRIRADSDVVRAWHTYHLIGDSIRGDAELQANLVGKVMSRIESEPTVLAPIPRRAATNSRLRWALPLAASVMGVGAVAWMSQSLNRQTESFETVSRTAVPPPAGAPNLQASSVASVVAPTAPAPQTLATGLAMTGEAAALATALPPQTLATGLVVPVQATFGREYLIAHQAYSPGAKMSGVARYVRTVSESRDEPAR